jgi:hypothetical protein
MKQFKDAFLNILALLILVYLPFAFIANEFNPTKWFIAIRALYVVVLAAIITYAIKDYQKK